MLSNTKAIVLFVFLIACNSNLNREVVSASKPSGKQRDTLYIYFDSKQPKNFKTSVGDKIYFTITPQIDASRFVYDNSDNSKQGVKYKNFTNKFISKEELNKRFLDSMESKDVELQKSTGERGYLFSNPPYSFDKYFKNIYIYEPSNENEGQLYKVSWQYAVQ
ncbi:hypothetical protein Q763_16635 [Flavobacterium beibuense F44-8]|uniref:Lipoprotein n=2 Tax=Flavobacterium beibuense TaxID=657326 RepID=A0A0A2LI07_9FLAO|nr:hypothetical protein Q763_16635 [Flavobacterium beibuense F44-8]